MLAVNMLGFAATPVPPPSLSISKSVPIFFNNNFCTTPSFLTESPLENPRNLRKFVVLAKNSNSINNDTKENNNGFNSQADFKKDERYILNFTWRDLLNPDPENIVAVGLTGLLTWASVQVLWQLFLISIAIVSAALKYSFIAALLLFILITLL